MISNDYMKDSNLQAQIAELANSVGSGAKIQTGSYVGTGTYGASNPCSLTFDFVPKFWGLIAYNFVLYVGIETRSLSQVFPWGIGNYYMAQYAYGSDGSPAYSTGTISYNNKTVSYYSSSNNSQYNSSGATYYYFAIG